MTLQLPKVTAVNTRSNDFKWRLSLDWSVNGVWEEKDLRDRVSSSFFIHRSRRRQFQSKSKRERTRQTLTHPSSHNLRDKFTISSDTFQSLLHFPSSSFSRLGHFRHKVEELGRCFLLILPLLQQYFVAMLSLMWICLAKRNSTMTQSEEEDGWMGWLTRRLKGFKNWHGYRNMGGKVVGLLRDCTWWSFSSFSSPSR